MMSLSFSLSSSSSRYWGRQQRWSMPTTAGRGRSGSKSARSCERRCGNSSKCINECKRVRRLLRAKAICTDQSGKKFVRRDRYDVLLERLNDAQLRLEFYKRYVKWNADLFEEAVGVAEHLEKAKESLNCVVAEWEKATEECSSAESTYALKELPKLKELIVSAKEGFVPCVAVPVEMVLQSLADAIIGRKRSPYLALGADRR